MFQLLPDGCESNETEVSWGDRRPVLPHCEEYCTGEDEPKDEDEVDSDGDHDQVCGHVPLLTNLVKCQTLAPPVHSWRQLWVSSPGSAPPEQNIFLQCELEVHLPAEYSAVQPSEGYSHPVTNLFNGKYYLFEGIGLSVTWDMKTRSRGIPINE